MSEVNVSVVAEDITRVEADGLITAINSNGRWYSGIDKEIQRLARRHFHGQAFAKMPLHDGQTIVAYGYGHCGNRAFKHVVFVVDDLKRPVEDVVFAALKAADEAGLASVTLPAFRMGDTFGIVEKTEYDVVAGMRSAVKKFKESDPKHIKIITLVINTTSYFED